MIIIQCSEETSVYSWFPKSIKSIMIFFSLYYFKITVLFKLLFDIKIKNIL